MSGVLLSVRRSEDLGHGFLARASVMVYRLVVVELLFLLCTTPGFALALLLDRDASNLLLAAVLLLPAAPALSAAVSALAYQEDLTDLSTGRRYLRALRLNTRDVLALWAPLAVVLSVLAFGFVHRDVAGVPPWWAGLLVAAAAVGLAWGLNALVIASLFTFRIRDTARLAAYFLARRPATTAKHLSLLLLLGAVAYLSSEAVLGLLGSVIAVILLSSTDRLRTDITQEFLA